MIWTNLASFCFFGTIIRGNMSLLNHGQWITKQSPVERKHPTARAKLWWLVHQSWGFCISQHLKLQQDEVPSSCQSNIQLPKFYATWACVLHINRMPYAWVKTASPRQSEFCLQSSRFLEWYPAMCPANHYSERGSCWGDARPRQSYNADSSWPTASSFSSLKCQNDSPPPSWPQPRGETQLTHVEPPRARDRTRSDRDGDHTEQSMSCTPTR